MWIKFLVGSHLAPRVLLGFSGFPSHGINQHLKTQVDQDYTARMETGKADAVPSLNILIFFISFNTGQQINGKYILTNYWK